MTSCKVWTTVAHHNTVLRRFVSEIVFLRGSDCQGKKILERKPFSNRLWSYLIGIQVSTVSCEALKHVPTVQPFHDLVSVLCSLVSCTLPWTLGFMVTVLCHLCNALWVAHKYFGMCNTNRLGRSPDHFPRVVKNGLWTRLCTSRVSVCVGSDGVVEFLCQDCCKWKYPTMPTLLA